MTAEEFGKYLKKLRVKRNLTTRQLEIQSGVSNSYISQIENGKRGIPKPNILKKLFPILRVPYEELMKAAGYLKQNETIVKLIDGEMIVTDNQYKFLKGVSNIVGEISDREMYRVPIIGQIPAGVPCLAEVDIQGYEDIPRSWLNGHPENFFVLMVKGDSMEGARIFDGDSALIYKQPTFENGQICAVAILDDMNEQYATLKRVYDLDSQYVELVPENPKYSRRKVERKNIKIYGILRKIIRNY